MDNNINFHGAFLIKKTTPVMREEIEGVLGKHKQIFYDLNEKGDAFYILRSHKKDKNVADILNGYKKSFAYYPELSTRSGFDDQEPENAKKIIKASKSPIIRTKEKLDKFFLRVFPPKREKNLNYAEIVIKNTELNLEGYKLCPANGKTILRDKNNKIYAHISAPSKNGAIYVYIQPKTTDDEPLRYMIDASDGVVMHKYVGIYGARTFVKNFNKAVEYNKNLT